MKVHEVPFYTLCRIMDPWFKNASPLGHDFFSLWVHDSTLGLQLHLVYNPGPRIYFSMWVHDSTLGLPRYLMYNPGPRKYFSMWFHDSTLGRPWHLVYNHGPRIYFSKWVHDSTLGLPLQVYNWTSCTILDPGFFFLCGPMRENTLWYTTAFSSNSSSLRPVFSTNTELLSTTQFSSTSNFCLTDFWYCTEISSTGGLEEAW